MAETGKRAKKKKARSVERRERMLAPTAAPAGRLTLIVTCASGLVLGAGVYSQLLRPEPLAIGPYLVGAGALALAAIILIAPDAPRKTLVGAGGIGEETKDGPKRTAWCDVTNIALEGDALVAVTEEGRLVFPLASHRPAAQWILKEASERIPARLSLDDAERQRIGEASEQDGETRALEPPQLAGKRCKASGRVISYEPDARVCDRCGEVYHRSSVPERCLTCDEPLDHLRET